MLPSRRRRIAFAFAVLASASLPLAADGVPARWVVDVRVIEARSAAPNFKAMEELSFFIDTDGSGVSESQWLATIARQAPNSFLATLAFETLSVDVSTSELRLDNRARSVRLALSLSEPTPDDVFGGTVTGELGRGDMIERAFEQDIELRVGQTYVWCSRDLELSGTEYLSHFREYRDRDHRAELYSKLREFSIFLIVAYSVRVADDADARTEWRTLTVPDDVTVPDFGSVLGIDIAGTVELDLDVDPTGAPSDVKIARSSIPELNSQILAEVATWRFLEARGAKGRLTLELEAAP
jgi:hypothetical protein